MGKKEDKEMLNTVLMIVGFISGVGLIAAMQKEYEDNNKERRRLKRCVVKAYYAGQREGMGTWLKK